MPASSPYMDKPITGRPRGRSDYRPQVYRTPLKTATNAPDATKIPLKARKEYLTQPAFKGILVREAGDMLFKTERLSLDTITRELRAFVPEKANLGLDDTINKAQQYGVENIRVNRNLWDGFKDAVTDPFYALGRWLKRLFGDERTKKMLDEQKAAYQARKRLVGYLLETRSQASRFDKVFTKDNVERILKINDEEALKKFLKEKNIKPDPLIKAAGSLDALKKGLTGHGKEKFLATLRNKYVNAFVNYADRKKLGRFMSGYGSDGAYTVNRVASGTTTGVFLGTDFYNLTMGTSGDREKAEEDRNKIYAQTAAYVGIYAYLGYVLNAAFSRIANKSLGFAVGLGTAVALSANAVSRLATGIPLFPKKSENVDKNPYVIHAAPLDNKPYAAALNTYNSFKGTNTPVSFTGNPFMAVEGIIKASESKMISAFPARVEFDKFEKTRRILMEEAKNGSAQSGEIADEMRKIAGAFTKGREEAGIDEIRQAAAAGDGYINIGGNWVYRAGKAFLEGIALPFKLLVGLGRMIVNAGRKLVGKEPFEAPDNKPFDHAKYVENVIKGVDDGTLSQKIGKAHGADIMDYPSDKLSTWMKVTGFTTVPFLAVQAYNETLDNTNNENIAEEKAKQRVLQDSARQGISFWSLKVLNDLFKGLINHSLWGNGTVVVVNAAGYETLTRMAVGQPVLPKTHEEMKEIEKKKLKDHSWFHDIMGGNIKTHGEKVVVGSTGLRPEPGASNNSFESFLSYNKKYGL